MKTLDLLHRGERSKVKKIHATGVLSQRIRDIGLYPGMEVQMIKAAPLGDPLEVKVNENSLTLRINEAKTIEVE